MSLLAEAPTNGWNAAMSQANENRIRELRKARDMTLQELADLAGTSNQQISKLESGRARLTWQWMVRIGAALGVAPAEIAKGVPMPPILSVGTVKGNAPLSTPLTSNDVDPSNIVTENLAGGRDLPVYASAMGGKGEMIVSYEPIEYVKRPSVLEGVVGGFAMYVVGDSMEPRYEPGEMLLVHPRKNALPGDHVLVVKTNGRENEHEALVKRLVRFNGSTYRLKQYNPTDEFDLGADEVQNCFVVVGTYGRRR